MEDPVEIRAAKIAHQTALVQLRTAQTELARSLVSLVIAALGFLGVVIGAVAAVAIGFLI